MMEGDLTPDNELKLKEFVCGWIAAIAQITITYPIYKIQVRQVLITKYQSQVKVNIFSLLR